MILELRRYKWVAASTYSNRRDHSEQHNGSRLGQCPESHSTLLKQYWRFNPISNAITRPGAGVDDMERNPMLYKDGLWDLTGEQDLQMKIVM